MKKRLFEQQFHAGIKGLDTGHRTIDIAFGVLVLGDPQTVFITSLGLSKGGGLAGSEPGVGCFSGDEPATRI